MIEKRSNFRLSFFSDIIWSVMNTIELFVRTLINPKARIPKKKTSSNDTYKKPSYGKGNGGGANIKTLPKDCPKGG